MAEEVEDVAMADKPELEVLQSKVVPIWMKRGILINDNETISIDEVEKVGITSPIKENLKKQDFEELFPVQTKVVPEIIKSRLVGGDFVICFPTGSGKTLAYVLPIVQVLQSRKIPRLRALIIAPTRTLVIQIGQVFRSMCSGTNLRTLVCSGQKTLKEEQNIMQKSQHLAVQNSLDIDIIVITPGRLIDHLEFTPSFHLQDLQYLVIDEADRVIAETYSDWLPRVFESITTTKTSTFSQIRSTPVPSTPTREISTSPKLQKLVVSATITQNPTKLSLLRLENPKYFAASASYVYKLPPELKQYMVVVDTKFKPTALMWLIDQKMSPDQRMLCFTSNLFTTQRLALVLQSMLSNTQYKVVSYTKNLEKAEKMKFLEDFKKGTVNIVVSSDILTRGTDIGVDIVVNYDAPSFITTYIHRVGRTARAGKSGTSYTLIPRDQANSFAQITSKAENGTQIEIELSRAQLEQYQTIFDEASISIRQKKTNQKIYGTDIRVDNENPEDQHVIMEKLKDAVTSNFFNDQ
eukprot:TRINITY_DN5600_c0_g1_i6.p1 TRINITY_DN5600_c0_g1~~TRINITY_DN5600_c0_g1_i6.p1  ORF type:complete len:548 (-),score=81.11 TRINITY_DN5600_c0_g1_i6:53-1618(-)